MELNEQANGAMPGLIWLRLGQGQYQNYVKTLMNDRVARKVGNFLTGWGTVGI